MRYTAAKFISFRPLSSNMPAKSLPLAPSPEAREHVLEVIRSSSEPLAASAIGKLLSGPDKIAGKLLTALLEELASAGTLHRIPGKSASAKPRYWDRDPQALARAAVLKAIDGTDAPLTASEIVKRLPKQPKLSAADVEQILEELVAAGVLHKIPPKTRSGKPRYWHRDALEFGHVAILKTLDAKGPQAESALRKAVKELSDVQFGEIVRAGLAAGTLWRHPPLKKSKPELLGNRPPAPESYLHSVAAELSDAIPRLLSANVPPEAVRRALVQMIEAAGISFGSSASAPRDISPSQTESVDLIALIRRIEPGADRGALVGARDLRRAARLEKSQFDRAVLELSRQNRLSLHRHDYAASLTQAERDELVSDGAGTYYVGVALRRHDT